MPYDKSHKGKSRIRIIEAATELFSRFGFDKVAIGQVMKEAHMTHGAFYSHFESKEALYAECFSELLKESSRARLVKYPLTMNKLLALTDNYWGLHQFHKMQPGLESVLFNELGSDNDKIKQLFQQSYDNVRIMLERRIVALCRIRKIGLTSEYISDRARVIMASLVGAVTIAKMISNEDERQKLLKTAQAQILSMLGNGKIII
ncbi:TetR/AcrR family transcriptional regulator [Celerinatantimonas yamalensis]|uniref:TetR/AcrR family transcriptional regulator n=1 Tax=Celerinatantimonas yamalensis TaxID=559956 RepID=A0ABW9G197_9GAMM